MVVGAVRSGPFQRDARVRRPESAAIRAGRQSRVPSCLPAASSPTLMTMDGRVRRRSPPSLGRNGLGAPPIRTTESSGSALIISRRPSPSIRSSIEVRDNEKSLMQRAVGGNTRQRAGQPHARARSLGDLRRGSVARVENRSRGQDADIGPVRGASSVIEARRL